MLCPAYEITLYRGSVACPAYDKASLRGCVLPSASGVTAYGEGVVPSRSAHPLDPRRGEPTAEDGPLFWSNAMRLGDGVIGSSSTAKRRS